MIWLLQGCDNLSSTKLSQGCYNLVIFVWELEGSVSGELVGCAFSDGFIVAGCERSDLVSLN